MIMAALLIGFIPFFSVYATDGDSLAVTPSIIDESLISGNNKSFSFKVDTGFALDVEIGGLGQTTTGSNRIISAQEDTSTFSARSWISVDKNHLEPGVNQVVTITVNAPSGTTGERYAAMYLYSKPGVEGNAAIISGIIVPLIFTVDSVSYNKNVTGQISDLKVSNNYRGKALHFLTSFSNTGNCRIGGASNKVTVKDSSQNVKWQDETAIVAPSIIPNYPRIIDARYNVGLDVGSYSVISDIILANGTVYSKTLNFTIIEPPPIPAAPVLVAPGNGTVPGLVIDTLTPNFEWKAVSGADYYELSISRDPYTANDIVYNSDHLTGTSFTLPSGILFTGQKYSWQMTATNVTGTSPASTAFYFRTFGSPESRSPESISPNPSEKTPAISKLKTVTPPGPMGVSWIIVGVVVGGILIIGILLVLLLTRSRSSKRKK
jgi:hypothetical protein